jgi:acyl-CoA synthetase (AMP-forming)/AMP-acid ligase II
MSHCYYADIDHLDETDTKLHARRSSPTAPACTRCRTCSGGGHQFVLAGPSTRRRSRGHPRHPNVTLFGAPTMVTRLVTARGVRRADTRNLKTLYYGGGPMYVADLEARPRACSAPKLFQVFGQGESP